MVVTTLFCLLLLTLAIVGTEGNKKKVWSRTNVTLDDFEVAGVNLALYGMEEATESSDDVTNVSSDNPYELFEEFDCLKRTQLNGDESWWGMQQWFRHGADERGLVFYNDKVAQKEWLQTRKGIDIPKPFVLRYGSDLETTTGAYIKDHQKEAILKLLPKNVDYVAKPSHQAMSRGVWVVSYDPASRLTRISRNANETMHDEQMFNPEDVAQDLAHHLYTRSKVQKALPRPGFVVEERFTAFDRDDLPALEFKVLTLWGRVVFANWRRGGWLSEWNPGVVDRNGHMVEGSVEQSLPEWVDWSRVVEIAERLGAHKDMFRVDVFVGVAAGSPALRPNATKRERREAVRYVVSEMSHISHEPFPLEVLEESVRLWIAGYKIGNYRVVPNTEIPSEFQSLHEEQHSEL